MLDFKVTSKRSWLLLLGFVAFGGFTAWRIVRRKQLLAELEGRENRLKELEQRYEELQNNAEITREAYEDARKALDQAKIDAAVAVVKADEDLQERLSEIEREFQDLSVDESLEKLRAALDS